MGGGVCYGIRFKMGKYSGENGELTKKRDIGLIWTAVYGALFVMGLIAIYFCTGVSDNGLATYIPTISICLAVGFYKCWSNYDQLQDVLHPKQPEPASDATPATNAGGDTTVNTDIPANGSELEMQELPRAAEG